jgi:hypothetical protein
MLTSVAVYAVWLSFLVGNEDSDAEDLPFWITISLYVNFAMMWMMVIFVALPLTEWFEEEW